MKTLCFAILTLCSGVFLAIALPGCHASRGITGPLADTTQASRMSDTLPPSDSYTGLPLYDPHTGRPFPDHVPVTSPLLDSLLSQYPQYFDSILRYRSALGVQVLYTRIDRNAANEPVFTDYYFNVDPENYFYPASTVKLPVALLALRKLNQLRLPGLGRNSTLITEREYSGQTSVYNDPTSQDGRPTIAQYIKKIFLVSDNDAFNRLYEFLGPEYIREQLSRMGYGNAAILHRLSVPLSEDENRNTNPITFYDPSGRLLYHQPQVTGPEIHDLRRHDRLGSAYYSGDSLVTHPMNFSQKNRISLEDLHHILRSVLFPNSVPASQRFDLSDSDYAFVYRYLSEFPSEEAGSPYDSASYPDAYGKFLYWGSTKERLPKNIRIFNKIGDAYGCMTDISYFTDFDKKVEFMLSATIYCNSDGIINDDKYDYETVGLPFMKNLGRVIYQYEAERKRSGIPDLSWFVLTYR